MLALRSSCTNRIDSHPTSDRWKFRSISFSSLRLRRDVDFFPFTLVFCPLDTFCSYFLLLVSFVFIMPSLCYCFFIGFLLIPFSFTLLQSYEDLQTTCFYLYPLLQTKFYHTTHPRHRTVAQSCSFDPYVFSSLFFVAKATSLLSSTWIMNIFCTHIVLQSLLSCDISIWFGLWWLEYFCMFRLRRSLW